MSMEEMFGAEPAPEPNQGNSGNDGGQDPGNVEPSQEGLEAGAAEAPSKSEPPATGSEDPNPQGAQPPEKDNLVSALTEERARRRQLQQQNEMMQQRFNELMVRLQQPQPAQAVQQQAPEIPKFEDDPAGHLQALQSQLNQQLQEVNRRLSQHDQRSQLVDQHIQFVQAVAAREAEFAASHPDYQQASQYIQDRKIAEYKALGLDEASARQALARDTMAVAQMALQRNQNPAELLYNAAKALGFAGVQQQPAVQAAKPATPTSLSGVGGTPGEEAGQPTLDAISKMSDAEFDAWWDKMAKQHQGARLQ